MKLSFASAKTAAALLALAGVVACADSTGSDSRIDGTFQVRAARLVDTGLRVQLPGTLYERHVQIQNVARNIRHEVLSSSITFDGDSTYVYSAAFRISDVGSGDLLQTGTIGGGGIYRVIGRAIIFDAEKDTDHGVTDGVGALEGGVLVVKMSDPFIKSGIEFEFTR